MGRLPLEGVRVVDSTYVFAFPYAGGIMTDLGADVIKIEGPGHTDGTRGGAFAGAYPDNEPGDDPWNRAAGYNQLNRGKRSLTLDLSKDEGREVLVDVLKTADIFMENYTPRVLRRWGLDYPNLKKINPRIIMMSNTGYGHGEGPWSMYPAQATTQEATHGHCAITGYFDGPPSKAGQSYVDFLSTWNGLLGASLALRHRLKSGEGQWVDVGMYQAGVFMTSEYVLDYIANGNIGRRIGNRHRWRAPQNTYRCAGTDQWCVISVGDEQEWAALCVAIGRPDLVNDPRFDTPQKRWDNHDEIDPVINAWTSTLDKFQVMEQLQAVGVPSGPVYDARDTNLDPQYWERGFLEKVAFPAERGMGTRVMMGRPWKMSKAPMSIKAPAPALGGANHDILVGELGYSEEKYKELWDAGIIGDRPLNPRPMPTMTMDDMVKAGRFAYWDPDYKQKLGI